MIRRALASLAIIVLCLVSANDASAERVVLVRPEPDDAMLVDAWHRLEAELRINDFDTDAIDASEGASPEAILEDAAERRDAFAAIALVHHGSGTSVDVWLVDRVSGKTTKRTIEVKKGADAASVLAIRAVDLLRTSLREFSSGERPPADVARVERKRDSRALDVFRAPPEPRVHLAVGAALLVERGFGVALGPALGLSYRFTDAFEATIRAAGPLLGARLETYAGSASLEQEMVWVGGRFRFIRSRWIDAGADAAFGAYFMSAEGAPRAPLLSRTDHVAAFLGGIGLDSALRVSSSLAFVLGVRALATAPRAGVAVGPASSPIGLPIVMASAELRVGL